MHTLNINNHVKVNNNKCKLKHYISTMVICGNYVLEFSVNKDAKVSHVSTMQTTILNTHTNNIKMHISLLCRLTYIYLRSCSLEKLLQYLLMLLIVLILLTWSSKMKQHKFNDDVLQSANARP